MKTYNRYEQVFPHVLYFLVEHKLLSLPQVQLLLEANNIFIIKASLLRMINRMKNEGLIVTASYFLPTKIIFIKVTNTGISAYKNLKGIETTINPLVGFPSEKIIDHTFHIGKFYCLLYSRIHTLDYQWNSNPGDNILLYQVGEQTEYRKRNELSSDAWFSIKQKKYYVEVDLLSENTDVVRNKFSKYFKFMRYQYATERILSPILFAVDTPSGYKQRIDAQVDSFLQKIGYPFHTVPSPNVLLSLSDGTPFIDADYYHVNNDGLQVIDQSKFKSYIRKFVTWNKYIFPRMKSCIRAIIDLSYDASYDYVYNWLSSGLNIYVNSFEGCVNSFINYEELHAYPYYAFALVELALLYSYGPHIDTSMCKFNVRPSLSFSPGFDFSPDIHAFIPLVKRPSCLDDYQGVFIEDLTTGNASSYWRILQYINHIIESDLLIMPEEYKFFFIVNGPDEKLFLESLVHTYTRYELIKERMFYINRSSAAAIADLFYTEKSQNKLTCNYSSIETCYDLFTVALYN